MSSVILTNVRLDEPTVRESFSAFNDFVSGEVKPHFLGIKTIAFCIELGFSGYDVVVETNRPLNNQSRQYLKALTDGFFAGYAKAIGVGN